MRVLLSVDNTSINPDKGKRADRDYAIAWIRQQGEGRVFYSSLGHREEIFRNPLVMQFYLDGIQYACGDYVERLETAGILLSMSRAGCPYDNAMAESFFATLECELIDRATFKTRQDAEMATFDFIEAFYNPKRRHSALGYASPRTFEERAARVEMPNFGGTQGIGLPAKTAQAAAQALASERGGSDG